MFCASILFLSSWIIFMIITLNSFSGRLPIYTSLTCSSGGLSCSFVWNIFLCQLILSKFLTLYFYVCGRLDVSQPSRSGPLYGMSYLPQQYTPLSSPKGQAPAGPRVVSDLHLQSCSSGCRIVVFLLLCLPQGEWGWSRGLWRLPSGRGWCLPTGGWSWVLALWWAGPCQGGCLEAAVGSGSL